MNSFKDLDIKPNFPLNGTKQSIREVLDNEIILLNFRFIKVVDEQTGKLVDATQIQYKYPEETVERVTFTRSKVLSNQLMQVNEEQLPFSCTIRKKNGCMYLE